MAVTYTSTEKADVDKVVEAASTLTLRTMFTSQVASAQARLDEAQANLEVGERRRRVHQRSTRWPTRRRPMRHSEPRERADPAAGLDARRWNAVGAAAMSSTIASATARSTGSGRSSTSTTAPRGPCGIAAAATPRPSLPTPSRSSTQPTRRRSSTSPAGAWSTAPRPDAHRHRRGRRRLPPGAPPRGHARGDRPGRHERSSAEAAAAADTAVYTPSHRANGASGAPGTKDSGANAAPANGSSQPGVPARAKH